NSLYSVSHSRTFHSEFARMACVRWVIQVVAIEAMAPTNEPIAAAIAVQRVTFTGHRRRGRCRSLSSLPVCRDDLVPGGLCWTLAARTESSERRNRRYW